MSQASVAARRIRERRCSLTQALGWADVKFGAASAGNISFTAHFPDGSSLSGEAHLDDIAPSTT
jgi:hypothetical protein